MIIQGDTVHIWHLNLNGLQKNSQELTSFLTNDEKERHSGYAFDIDGELFARRRYFLKSVLALYLGINVNQVCLSEHKGGKPFLGHNAYKCDITFNISHSGEHFVVAIGKENPVGVDVEKINTIAEIDAISKMIMTVVEYRRFCRLDENQKLQIFYQLWTRKESVVKALGAGLSYPIQELDVSNFTSGEHTVFLNNADNDACIWHVYDIDLCDTHSCALTTQNNIDHIIIKKGRDILRAL